MASSLSFAAGNVTQLNPQLSCPTRQIRLALTLWVSGSGPGPRHAWQSVLVREGATLSQAGACAHASALISLLIEPLNVLPLPDPSCCFSFLPFAECLFIVTRNKRKKTSYKLFVPPPNARNGLITQVVKITDQPSCILEQVHVTSTGFSPTRLSITRM